MMTKAFTAVWMILGTLAWTLSALGAGVTVITHGYNANVDGWVTGMANQIPNYPGFPGDNYSVYKLALTSDGTSLYYQWTFLQGTPSTTTDSGEIIIKLDWSQIAGGTATYNESTYNVASAASYVLEQTSSLFGGHAPAELPIHLIGHSRGGSLTCEMSKLLGQDGIWVDHLTSLDPHPLNNDGNFDLLMPTDATAKSTYLNVLFRDNYWQDVPGGLFDFNGEEVYYAYNRYLDGTHLSGGYLNITSFAPYHSNVHLWYHGTVDTRTPAYDSEAQVTGTERDNWYVPYEDYGLTAGFRYSLIGSGDRASSDRPLGGGFPAIRDGYNQIWDFGIGQTGNRNSLPSNNGAWPNIIKFDIASARTVGQSNSVSFKYYYQYAQPASSNAVVQAFIDANANPYDGSLAQMFQNTESGTTSNVVRSRTFSFSATNAPGQYYVYAKVTAASRSRYLYAPGKLTITDVTPPSVFITNPPSAKTYTNEQIITISASASDNIGVTSVDFYDGGVLKGSDATPAYAFDWSFTAADNGAHDWTVRAYDAAGNASTSSVVRLTVSIDATPPTVAIASPTNGQVISTSPFSIRGTASDPGSPTSGVSVVQVRLNGGTWSNAIGTITWTNTMALSPCANVIEARSRDKAGNYSAIVSNFVTYVPANTVPATPMNISPASGASGVSVTPTLQASAFTDADCVGDTHASSQWQVLNAPGSVIVADSGTDTVNRASWPVPANKLHYGSNYQWKVRYRDSRNGWSSYSSLTRFTNGGPLLSVRKQGTNLVFKWPTNAPAFALQWSTNLGTPYWSNATPAPVIVSGQYTVTNNMTNKSKFYRLKK